MDGLDRQACCSSVANELIGIALDRSSDLNEVTPCGVTGGQRKNHRLQSADIGGSKHMEDRKLP